MENNAGPIKAGSTSSSKGDNFSISVPSVNLPKGGGALKNIDEKFEVNAMNGTASYSLPLPISKTRSDFAPALSLNYNSGSGNSCFGLGWSLSLSAIQRRTDKKLPEYKDATDTDIFMLTGSEDLVPVLQKDALDNWQIDETTSPKKERIRRYRPRIETGFSRIERITPPNSTQFYWKITSAANITTIYGRSKQAQIIDPLYPDKIFKWLPEFSFDDKGNCLEYEYVTENRLNVASQLHEQNRINGLAAFTNSYLKRVKYGNTLPYSVDSTDPYNPAPPANPQYVYEIVFDFGDHNADTPLPAIQQDWLARADAFSDYRAGFEIRTYRLCQRILFFHYFKELGNNIDQEPVLVRSLNIQYRYCNNPAATIPEKRNAETDYILSVTQSGYKKTATGYTKKSLPPIGFTYQELKWNTLVQDVPAASRANAPIGIGDNYQWLDLWNEGISGILTEQAGGWFYKSNLGNGNFSRAAAVMSRPSFTGMFNGGLQLQDLEADGRKFIVSLKDPVRGYFELNDENNGWQSFTPFPQLAQVDLNDPNIKFIDLNGDGRPDIIIADEHVFTWYGNQGMMGYDSAELAHKPYDEEKGAAITFRDPEKSIFLTDMSGDGLTDIVRIRNGEICYWPNLGYGKFGAKVNMSDAPIFDAPDMFNPAYLHLADVSGTGATDILYIGNGQCHVWLNLSGNAWSDDISIHPFPDAALPSQVTVVDFLGNGTATIVWSSSLPGYEYAPFRYIDLMGGKKPYIISSYANGLGKVVTCEYTSSSVYYLQDKQAGTPWVTRLPFPVHCVSKLMTNDLTSGIYLTNSYSYHHGYYDHAEREFRGFGRVEQTDTEDFMHFMLSAGSNVVEKDLHQPPVKVVTWYHTGAYIDEAKILNQFAHEYNKSPLEFDLPAPLLPPGLNAIEIREALRACKGMILRREVYAMDGTPLQPFTYTADTHNCLIKLLQPRNGNQYAAFYNHESEAASFYNERNPADPRISHTFNLEVDDFGNVLQSASVVYGRKTVDPSLPTVVQEVHGRLHVQYTIHSVTNHFDDPGTYRLPLPAETKTYELTGLLPLTGNAFTGAELINNFSTATGIKYEDIPNNVSLQKRLIEQVNAIYLNNDLTTPLVLGNTDTLGLIYQQYKLTFTPSLLTHLFGSNTVAVNNPVLTGAGYVQADGVNWWAPSGMQVYLNMGEMTANAQQRFYMPVAVKDPLNSETKLHYDPYFLALTSTTDAVHNVDTIEAIDYRLLQPTRLKDRNANISEALLDELGMVIATSTYGEEEDGMHGDKPLSGYSIIEPANLDEVMTNPLKFLQQATSFFYYDLNAWVNAATPVCFAGIVRETHESELQVGEKTRVLLSVGYSSGLGHSLQTKIQADPGNALQWSGNLLVTVDTSPDPRWIGSGRTIFNNKGNPVIAYEPFYSTTYKYEQEAALVEIGFSSIHYYDPLGRNILIRHPNDTLSRVEFDAWQQLTWDENDTVLESGWYTAQGSPNPLGPEPVAPATRAAWLAAKHANTPENTYLDTLGRKFYTISNNAGDGNYATQNILDIENNTLAVIDDRNNMVVQFHYDMVGRKAYLHSMDKGEKWTLLDVVGAPVQEFTNNTDSLGKPVSLLFRHEYDALHRPTNLWLTSTTTMGSTLNNIAVIVYGEGQPNDMQLNLRGAVFQQFDQSGLLQMTAYNFKGSLKKNFKQFTIDYKHTINWNVADKNTLLNTTETFNTALKFNATNRPAELSTPDGSRIMTAYNLSGLLNKVNVWISSQLTTEPFVQSITYNAKGQRDSIVYGNNTATSYTYEDTTYRLIRLLTTRNAGADILQDLNYTYDPVNNITQIIDNAQQTVFFNNAKVDPGNKFQYDAIYRLIYATGREYAGTNAVADQFDSDKTKDGGGNRLLLKGDMNAMQSYEQLYSYDQVGNMLEMIHNAGNGGFTHRWTRQFTCHTKDNRLEQTQVGAPVTNYSYDLHGNMLQLQNASFALDWDFFDHLRKTDLGGGGTAYYVYDGTGQRVRKVIENGALIKERIYLGAYERYRETQGNTLQVERETVHVMDNTQRIAMIEVRTKGNDNGLLFLIRYQYGNHLSTACLETDQYAAIISYEEYYPFGSTSYQAMDNLTETGKRYRYTGKERDEESGLYFHGARYYAPWLARWTAADPIGIEAGINDYAYVKNNPIKLLDPNGTDDKPGVLSTGPNGEPVYQSTGDQALKDAGKVAKALGDELLKQDFVKELKKKFIDPQLEKLGKDAKKEWSENKVSVVIGGVTIVAPALTVLVLLAIQNNNLNVPIVGDVPTRQLVMGLAGAGTQALSEALTKGHLSVNFGYEKKDGADVYSFELKVTAGDTSAKPEDNTKKDSPAKTSGTPSAGAPTGLPDKPAASASQKTTPGASSGSGATSVTLSGKIGAGYEGQLKVSTPTRLGTLDLNVGLKANQTGQKNFTAGIGLGLGNNVKLTGSAFIGAPAATAIPFDPRFNDKANLGSPLPPMPPMSGNGGVITIIGRF